MPQIVWNARPDGWHTYFNRQWMDFTGLTLEESLGHGWNPPFHPGEEQARLLDLAQDAILVTDVDDRITYWNSAAERFYGWSVQEAVGRELGPHRDRPCAGSGADLRRVERRAEHR